MLRVHTIRLNTVDALLLRLRLISGFYSHLCDELDVEIGRGCHRFGSANPGVCHASRGVETGSNGVVAVQRLERAPARAFSRRHVEGVSSRDTGARCEISGAKYRQTRKIPPGVPSSERRAKVHPRHIPGLEVLQRRFYFRAAASLFFYKTLF